MLQLDSPRMQASPFTCDLVKVTSSLLDLKREAVWVYSYKLTIILYIKVLFFQVCTVHTQTASNVGIGKDTDNVAVLVLFADIGLFL